MPQFSEAMIYLADGGDPAQRVLRESALSRTAFVPVPDVHTAATAAAELLVDGLDLIELYGGLGPIAAAAVLEATDATVPVGLVGVEEQGAVRSRAMVVEAPGADSTRDRFVHDHGDGRMTIVLIPDAAMLPSVALDLVDHGVARIELCGGLGPVPAAAVLEAVGDRAQVASVMFGFESLPGAAAYRARFERALAN